MVINGSSFAVNISKPTSTLALELVTLCLVIAFSLMGNILVLAIIYKSRRVQWLTNMFVAHLAGANLLVPLLCGPFYLGWSAQNRWPLGNISCKIVHFLFFVNSGVSICMLTCIALDRYYVVVHPLSLHLRRSQTFQIITFIWILVIFSSTPSLYFFEIQSNSYGDFCFVQMRLSAWKGFIVAYSIISFFSPLIIMFMLYLKVLLTIYQRNTTSGQATNTVAGPSNGPTCQQVALGKVPKTKQKVVRMLLVQSTVFLLCWTPYYVIQLYIINNPHIYYGTFVIALWLSFFNAASNPLIYAVFNGNFRRGCRHLFSLQLSRPYALSHVMHWKNQVDVLDMSRHNSVANKTEIQLHELGNGTIQTGLHPHSKKRNSSIIKLFESKNSQQKSAWVINGANHQI